jgi:hypothetical protein
MSQESVSKTVFLVGIAGIIIAIFASSIVPPLLLNGFQRGQQGIQGIQGEPGSAGPQGDPGIGFARQGNISISHKSFISLNKDNIPWYGNSYLTNTKNSVLVLAAPIQLPDGVKITKVIFYYYDIDPGVFHFTIFGLIQTMWKQ